jgi:TRAP-type C4-dicarboxylate transport system substrate-binding protein
MMFSNWGANPTPLAFSELFVALQTGVVDGQENPLTNVDGGKLFEVQKFLSITDHVYSPIWLVAGARVWSRFPAELREAVAAVAAEVQAWSLAEGLALDRKLLADFEARGMVINRADRRAFVNASQPIYRAFAERVPGGQEMIDQVLALGGDREP